MKRRDFIHTSIIAGGAYLTLPSYLTAANDISKKKYTNTGKDEASADVAIIGGGVGGFAAALAACRNGLKVILTEETKWIGGQLSQQGVPPDEHQWIERHGAPASYREYRNRVRDYYKRNHPLTEAARNRENLNPGNGSVSRLCHEPMVSVAVLSEMLMPYVSSGKLLLLLNHKPIEARTDGDRVSSVTLKNMLNGDTTTLSAPYFVDATECGELLPLTGTEYVSGSEAKSDTNELHASDTYKPTNNQAFTVCFAMDYVPEADLTIDKPELYDFWKNYVPQLTPEWTGRLLDLSYSHPITLQRNTVDFNPEVNNTPKFNIWNYRKIIDRFNYKEGTYKGDITIVNWPQNDYLLGDLLNCKNQKQFDKYVNDAKQLNLSLFYWLQTEAPRPDGKQGWKGLRLRGDVLGSTDGMALYPYIRESRRIKAEFTILEEHVGLENHKLVYGDEKASRFNDGVGTGFYRIDLHPSHGGDNYIDVESLRFQIPLGALLPQRMENIFPACKNIGVTHITNGCYRLHPVEWSIGEAVGCLVAYSKQKNIAPKKVRNDSSILTDFQSWITKQGLETEWKE